MAAGLLAVVASGSSQVIQNYMQVQRNKSLLESRNAIYRFVGKALQNKEFIRISALMRRESPRTGNIQMHNCLNYTEPTCTQVGSGNPAQFNLYRSLQKNCNINQSSCIQRIAGTEANPVRFNLDGRVGCDPATDTTCIFESIAFFWAECYSGTTCAEAVNIRLRHQIRICDFSSTGACSAMGDAARDLYQDINHMPSTAAMQNATDFSFPLRVVDVKDAAAYRCTDDNAHLASTGSMNTFAGTANDRREVFKCVCNPGYRQIPSPSDRTNPGDVSCALMNDNEQAMMFDFCNHLAGEGYMVTGIKGTGHVECKRSYTTCRLYDRTHTFSCPAGQWMMFFQAGICRTGGGKKGGNDLDCEPSTAQCCGWRAY